MKTDFLKWDSEFFGFGISRVEIADSLLKKNDLNFHNNYLFYVFSDIRQSYLESSGSLLVDVKITYEKKITHPTPACEDVFSYQGPVNDRLLKLGVASGWMSRFNVDSKLNDKFKELYELWVINSVNRLIADDVLVVEDKQAVVGLVTLKKTQEIGSIGILAVDENCRGMGMGGKLMQAVDHWYYRLGVMNAEVVAQGRNSGACKFYESNGYTVKSVKYVYHVWK